MKDEFEHYIIYSKGIKNVSEQTVTAYRADMIVFEHFLDESGISFDTAQIADIRIFAASLSDRGLAPATVNRMLSCVRGFYRYMIQKKLCTTNPAESVRNIKKKETLPRFLFPDEALELCSLPEHAGILWYARDKALFSALYSTGCRISELLSLTAKNIEIPCTAVIVRGKGRKERKIFFTSFAQDALQAYLPERQALLEKKAAKNTAEAGIEALFLNHRGKALSARGVQYIIDRYTAFLPHFKRISPHTFRHSFASMFVARGADIRVVQELLGHSTLATTQRYTHITAEQLHAVYRKAHPHG